MGGVPVTPTLCPVCGCPIQLLAADNQGNTTGNLQDALNRRSAVVHPEEPAVLPK